MPFFKKLIILIGAVLCVICSSGLFPVFAAQESDSKIIVLNFDDGPKPRVLKELLPVLEKHRVPATFFVMGAAVLPNEVLIKLMREKGFEFENHSWGHENFRKLYKTEGAAGVTKSLDRAEAAIFRATGQKSKYFRPPFWEINNDIERLVVSRGYRAMKLGQPDINSLDYEDAAKRRSPDVLVARVKKIISDREKQGKYRHVLVFHELSITAQALQTLIPYFLSQGYNFTNLDEFMNQ